VDKLTPEKVENSNKEIVGRKAKPSNEMRFKINHGRVIYHGNIHFRNKRL
jgi:hypothetical protein